MRGSKRRERSKMFGTAKSMDSVLLGIIFVYPVKKFATLFEPEV
jgi:hypothetical protein